MAELPELHAALAAVERLQLLLAEPSREGSVDAAVESVVTIVRGCLRALDALAAEPSMTAEQRARLDQAVDACVRAVEANDDPPEASP
ncbi:MAG: hypothetical protein NVSMB47_22050 [Polyangiales bacterium]